MSLLKDDSSIPEKANNVTIVNWPQMFNVFGFGWKLGVGFGLGVITVLLSLSCLIGIGLSIVGISLGTLSGG